MYRTDYYGKATAEFYDYHSGYRDRPDVSFFVEEAVAAGGPVLEVGCGTGRVLIPTARAGVSIAGLDFSETMLRVCREKLAREPAEVRERARVVQGDMREFSLGEKFRLVTIPFRPFQHLLSVEEQLACLACVRSHLQDGGRMILDLFNPSIERLADKIPTEEIDEGEPFGLPDGCTVQRRSRVIAANRFEQVRYIELIYVMTHADGRVERAVEPLTMRYFFRFEAEHLLHRAGFEVESLFADYDLSPYGSRDPGELIFVARKGNNAQGS